MNIIYKYPIAIVQSQVVKLPADYKILHVDFQEHQLTLWAGVDTDTPLKDVTIKVLGTGFEIEEPDNLEHIGTVQQLSFTWHVFEELDE